MNKHRIPIDSADLNVIGTSLIATAVLMTLKLSGDPSDPSISGDFSSWPWPFVLSPLLLYPLTGVAIVAYLWTVERVEEWRTRYPR